MSVIFRNRLDPDGLLVTTVTRAPGAGSLALAGQIAGLPGAQFWPGSFTDAVFTGMTTLNSTYDVPDGGTVTHRSTVETSGNPTASFGTGGGTLSYCRIDSAECVRHSESTNNYLIDWCWLQATGAPGDHADVIQAYAGGGAGGTGAGTLTIRNSMLILGGASTACLFSADNFGGKFAFDHVCVRAKPGDPGNRGISINSDGGTNASLSHVYVVRSPAFAQFDIGIDITIAAWANVYYCDLDANGQPTNLSVIPPP
jgi:hypothetical protein